MMFKCDKCGLCCRSLADNPVYKHLDRGNGTCRYLVGNLCSIYEKRPLLCRVDEAYEALFKDYMTKETYYAENYRMCKILKSKK